MKGTCRSCKWWKDGECERIGWDDGDVAASEADVHVRVLDDSGLTVSFVTGPEFGCLLHELPHVVTTEVVFVCTCGARYDSQLGVDEHLALIKHEAML